VPSYLPSGVMVSRLLDLVFPPSCAGCGARGAVLCDACIASIRPLPIAVCARCERALPPDDGGETVGLCARCRADTSGNQKGLAGLRVAAQYDGAVRQAIWQLKYHGQRRLAAPLGDLLAHTAQALSSHSTLVVPVPLHPQRRRQRGFNQAELLARRCAPQLGLAVRADVLARVRATPPQVGLHAAARHANVAGAFATTPIAPAALTGQRVLLIDDVCTSGATLAFAAGALLAGGSASVWGLVVARPVIGADGDPLRAATRGAALAAPQVRRH
jgi:ComF family protein